MSTTSTITHTRKHPSPSSSDSTVTAPQPLDSNPEPQDLLQSMTPYASPYLMEGFSEDKFLVDSFHIAEDFKSGTAKVSMLEYCMPGDGIFHLSALTSSRIFQQLLIVLVFKYLDRPKDREVFLLSQQFRYRRPIQKTEGIQYTFSQIQFSKRGNSLFIKCNIDVENASFVGEISGCIPL